MEIYVEILFYSSHVEDAVDYPSSGMGQSLYAHVDKNKNKAPSYAGSHVEYPDVVNDVSTDWTQFHWKMPCFYNDSFLEQMCIEQ